MEVEYQNRHRPQDDIPVEVIIHYIVKDYRNMWNRFQELEPMLKQRRETLIKYRAKIRQLLHELREKQIEAMPESELKKAISATIKRASDAEIENEKLRKEVERLTQMVKDVKENRNEVVTAVTSELEEQLEEANRKIGLLAHAVIDPAKTDNEFLQSCKSHIIETDDDRKWMIEAMRQLEKAAQKIISAEEKLINCAESLEKVPSTEGTERTTKIIRNAVSKINSTLSHVECFFDKIDNVEIKQPSE